MVIDIRKLWLMAIGAAVCFGTAKANDSANVLSWEDLMPKTLQQNDRLERTPDVKVGEEFDWEEDSFEEAFATPVHPTGVVEELDGQRVKLPGFIVPLEMVGEGKVAEFLLVPYFGACIHYPAPPPNQIVYVTLAEPVELQSMWDPVWLTGELRTESRHSDLGAAGYSMKGEVIEAYEY